MAVRYNTKDGQIGVAIGDDSLKWWKHPTEEKSVDVAVLPLVPLENADYGQIPVSMFATDDIIKDHNIGIGDEVFYTGLFTLHSGNDRSLPILRTGNVAMMDDEKLPRARIGDYLGPIDAYLIEVRSVSGLSGSPVFVTETVIADLGLQNAKTKEKRGSVLLQPVTSYLLGMMHGHWNIHPSEHNRYDIETTTKVSESIAIGISVVIPAKKILEVLNQEGLAKLRSESEKEWQERQGPTTSD